MKFWAFTCTRVGSKNSANFKQEHVCAHKYHVLDKVKELVEALIGSFGSKQQTASLFSPKMMWQTCMQFFSWEKLGILKVLSKAWPHGHESPILVFL